MNRTPINEGPQGRPAAVTEGTVKVAPDIRKIAEEAAANALLKRATNAKVAEVKKAAEAIPAEIPADANSLAEHAEKVWSLEAERHSSPFWRR